MHVTALTPFGGVQHEEKVVAVQVDLGDGVAVGAVRGRPGVHPEAVDERVTRLVVPGRDVDPHDAVPGTCLVEQLVQFLDVAVLRAVGGDQEDFHRGQSARCAAAERSGIPVNTKGCGCAVYHAR